jgi:hypothetical protein
VNKDKVQVGVERYSKYFHLPGQESVLEKLCVGECCKLGAREQIFESHRKEFRHCLLLYKQ